MNPLLAILACSGRSDDSAQAVSTCHSESSPDRNGAPEGVDFDTEEQVVTLAPLIRELVLEEGTMPVGGGVYEEDLALLDAYLDCGI